MPVSTPPQIVRQAESAAQADIMDQLRRAKASLQKTRKLAPQPRPAGPKANRFFAKLHRPPAEPRQASTQEAAPVAAAAVTVAAADSAMVHAAQYDLGPPPGILETIVDFLTEYHVVIILVTLVGLLLWAAYITWQRIKEQDPVPLGIAPQPDVAVPRPTESKPTEDAKAKPKDEKEEAETEEEVPTVVSDVVSSSEDDDDAPDDGDDDESAGEDVAGEDNVGGEEIATDLSVEEINAELERRREELSQTGEDKPVPQAAAPAAPAKHVSIQEKEEVREFNREDAATAVSDDASATEPENDAKPDEKTVAVPQPEPKEDQNEPEPPAEQTSVELPTEETGPVIVDSSDAPLLPAAGAEESKEEEEEEEEVEDIDEDVEDDEDAAEAEALGDAVGVDSLEAALDELQPSTEEGKSGKRGRGRKRGRKSK